MFFEKNKFMPANSHKNPNLTMHWQTEMENVACRGLVRVKVSGKVWGWAGVRDLLGLGAC